MLESSLKYLRCVRCSKKLELEKLIVAQEIKEGFLKCKKCKLTFPIISGVPILWDDFSSYLTCRASLGGVLLQSCSDPKIKKFVKKSLSKIRKKIDDRTSIEQRWLRIYQKNTDSNFYSKLKSLISQLPKSKIALEHGCSIGIISKTLAKTNDIAFGIDSSFPSILEAKKTAPKNSDFFVADSLFHPFGSLKFNTIVGLNLFEIVEPVELLKIISKQIKNGYLVLSDPYDYDRGKNSIKKPLDEIEIRKHIKKLGFKITSKTKKPGHISWNLKINPRTTLNYKVDVILAKK